MLLVANVTAQAVSVGLSPILSRIYSPGDFGMLGALTALIMICVPVTSWRYELAVLNAADDREAFEVLAVCAVAIVAMTGVFAALALFAQRVSPTTWAAGLGSYWYFLPICLGAVAFYEVLVMEASRARAMEPLASSKIMQAVAGVGGQIVFGVLGFGTLGLLLGFLINQAAGVTRLFRELVLGNPAKGAISWQRLRAVAAKHSQFPVYASWSSALDASTRWALQLAISTFWDPKVGGFIFLSDRIVGRPLYLMSTSLLPVYMGDLSHALRHDPKKVAAVFRDTLSKQTRFSLVWTAGVVAVAPWLITPVFGAEWSGAVRYVQLMALALAPTTTLHAVVHTLQLAGRQRQQSVLILSQSLVIVGALLVCHAGAIDALTTLSLFALIQFAFAAITYVLFRRAVAEMMAREPTCEASDVQPA